MWEYILVTGLFSASIIWSLPFLLLSLFGIKLYKVSDKETFTKISSKIKNASIIDDKDKPLGIFIGKYYIGFFSNEGKEGKQLLYIICSNTIYDVLTRKQNKLVENNLLETKEEIISVYDRRGNYFWMEYIKRTLTVSQFTATEKQKNIIDDIRLFYESINNLHNRVVVYIYGEPGSGKSMISILMTKMMNGSLVKTFNPTEPGDNFATLYASISPTKENPLIVVLDEIDIHLDRIHLQRIPAHKHIPIQIIDKRTWNDFLDDINIGFYPYLILIMTSNISKEEIGSKYDISYLRENRVNLSYKLMKDNSI
jgi:hypothetical protein